LRLTVTGSYKNTEQKTTFGSYDDRYAYVCTFKASTSAFANLKLVTQNNKLSEII